MFAHTLGLCNLDLSRLLHLIGLSKVTSASDRPRNSILPQFSTNGEVTMKNLIGLSKQVTSASTNGEVSVKWFQMEIAFIVQSNIHV